MDSKNENWHRYKYDTSRYNNGDNYSQSYGRGKRESHYSYEQNSGYIYSTFDQYDTSNIRYENQDKFVEKNSPFFKGSNEGAVANTVTQEFQKGVDESSNRGVPVPAPRNSVKKYQNEDTIVNSKENDASFINQRNEYAASKKRQYENSKGRKRQNEDTITKNKKNENVTVNQQKNEDATSKKVQFESVRVSKQQNEDSNFNVEANYANKGAKQKSKGKKGKGNTSVALCMTCEKAVCPDNNHRGQGHHVVPFQNGIQELEEKQINKLRTVVNETECLVKSEMQVGDMVTLWKSSINESLNKIFKKLEESVSQNTDRLLKLTEEGNNISGNAELAKITNLMQFMDLQNASNPVISEGQKLTSELQDKPFWLIFSWFKISMGLIVQSGRLIFAISKATAITQFAPFGLQGDRLLLYSLRPTISADKDTLLVPFDLVNNLFERDDFNAFLSISYSNKSKGCIFMRLDKETYWGNQFMALCSGELGPSLRNKRFFRSCGKGKPGHHVWGGDYTRDDGSGGDDFFKWNAPLVYHSRNIAKGLIAARPGVQDRSSIFRIYLTGEDPKQKKPQDIELMDKFAFGDVFDGLDVLAHVSDLPDISKSKIEDCGRFLVLT